MRTVEAIVAELREAIIQEETPKIRAEVTRAMVGILSGAGPKKTTASYKQARAEIRGLKPARKAPKMRTQDEIDRLSMVALKFIQQNPGTGTNQIAEHVGVSKEEIRFPIRKLKELHQVRTKGEKSNTTWYAKS